MTVSLMTGIRYEILVSALPLAQCNVAERMTWASTRKPTRTEDMAESLLGISDVHMSLLYGEGARAFTKLQEVILSRSEDYTVFLWTQICDGRDWPSSSALSSPLAVLSPSLSSRIHVPRYLVATRSS